MIQQQSTKVQLSKPHINSDNTYSNSTIDSIVLQTNKQKLKVKEKKRRGMRAII